jgi:hypothetical protein
VFVTRAGTADDDSPAFDLRSLGWDDIARDDHQVTQRFRVSRCNIAFRS